MSNRFVALLAIAALSLGSPEARGWEQTLSSGGKLLRWETSCYHWSLNESGSADVPADELEQLLREAYGAWEAPACSYFGFVETERAAVDEQEFHPDRGNVNLLVFRDEPGSWPYSHSVEALTSVDYDPDSGEILDVDIELNGEHYDFATLDEYPPGTTLIDLRSVATHEIGHTLGLDHSAEPEAVMYPFDQAGDTTKRDLHQDDRGGLCALYPAAEDPEVCEEPHCGLDLDGTSEGCETLDAAAGCGCAAAGRGGSTGASPLVVAFSLLPALALARRGRDQ